MLSRRGLLLSGGALFLAPTVGSALAAAPLEVRMQGNPDGSRVWFEPAGLLVRPGQAVRWSNADAANSHTATAYHPANGSRSLRMPEDAEPWDSGYLLPGESFDVVFEVPGVYDYYCRPHELAGMVGRIVVADGAPATPSPVERSDSELPEAVRGAFPPIAEITARGRWP